MDEHKKGEVTPHDPTVPADTIRLPERGFGIDRKKALSSTAMSWTPPTNATSLSEKNPTTSAAP